MIWSVPRSKDVIEETGYEKSLIFVRQDNFFVIRALHWVRDGGYKKYMDIKKLDLIDGIWVATEMHVTKKKGKNTVHKTILSFRNVKFNQSLDIKGSVKNNLAFLHPDFTISLTDLQSQKSSK